MIADRPTLKDVAREAGVSVSLASHALNNYPSIREETRRRVWAARQKLGYQPNSYARNLRARRGASSTSTRNIGLVIVETKPSYALYMPLIRAFSRDLQQRDLHPLVLTLPTDIQSERDLPVSLRERNMDGFLLTGEISLETLELFDSLDLPYVIIGNEEAGPRRCMVKADVATGTAEGMDMLFGLGHTSIGFVAERFSTFYHQEILAAFRTAYAHRGLECREEWIQASRDKEGGYEPMDRLLGLAEPPSAVLFANIRIAANALELARQRQLNIPEDISLLAFSGTEEPEGRIPMIDRIVVDYEAFGTVALKMLLDRITEPSTLCMTVSIPCAYHKGETCGRVERKSWYCQKFYEKA